MNPEEKRSAGADMIRLAICGIRGTAPGRELVHSMDLAAVRLLSEKHMVSAVVAMALESADCGDAWSAREIGKSVRRIALQDAERAKVIGKLEEAGIWYLPMKGVVLKELYPRYGMRWMGDQDFLIDPSHADDVRDIMLGLGYEEMEEPSTTTDGYVKPDIHNFEMHQALFFEVFNRELSQYYQDVDRRLVADGDGGLRRRFTDEDFYVYMTAHAYKHYSSGGIGVRYLLDVCVYVSRFEGRLDWKYIAAEMEKLGISAFERLSRGLAMKLYRDAPLSEEEEEMLGFILDSGVYGTFKHSLSQRLEQLDGSLKGKLKYIRSRLFLPMEYVKAFHPFVYRHRVLLPFLNLWRLVKALTVYWKAIRPELLGLFRLRKKG